MHTCTGGIIPLLLYGSPAWKKAIYKASYKSKLIRAERLINIRIANSYRTISNEALCILTGLTPIAIKIEETLQLYEYIRGTTKEGILFDSDMRVKYWHHQAETITFLTEDNGETSTIQIFTDGSKSDQGVGAGIVIFKYGNLINSLKYRLNKRCTNNQAEQLAILRALEFTENIETEDKTSTIHTDSRMTLDSLKNSNIHTYIIEEMRRKVAEMGEINWKIQFCWVKSSRRDSGK